MLSSRSGAEAGLVALIDALRVATSSSPDAAFVIDAHGKLRMANTALCAALGVDESAVFDTPFDMSARSTDPEAIRAAMSSALAGEAARYRGTGTTTTGAPFVADVTVLPLRVDGDVVAVYGTSVNLTAVEQHDLVARQSEDLVRLAGRLARFGGWSVDAATGAVSVSPGARSMLGLSADAVDITADAWARHPDDGRAVMESLIEACITEGTPFEVESVMYSTAGERLTIRTVGEAERAPDGSIVRAYGAVWDVSDAAAARQRERALEARLSLTLNSIADGIIFTGPDGSITFVNQHAADLVSRPEDEVLATTLTELFAGDNGTGFRGAFDEALRTQSRVSHRGTVFEPDRWLECTAFPTNEGLAVYIRDVTADEHTREAARQAQIRIEQQAALLDSARDAMIVRGVDNRVRYWNRAATELYGWSQDEAMGRLITDLIYDGTAEFDRANDMLMRDGYFADEVEQKTRDGRTLIVDCRWQLIPDPDGETNLVFAVNSDITEWRREQDARLRAQRMEALGTLTGGIAHDLNNVLTPILMSVQLLALDEHDSTRRELLATTETAVRRGAEMVRQVLSFVRGVEGRRIAVDVDQLLDEFIAITREALPEGVALETKRTPEMAGTVGDPTQLLQVLVNLATNARDAMAGSGTLRLSAEVLDIDDDYLTVSHSALPGSYIVIGVEDTGHGMQPDVQEKIFEPFYTTKPPGKGTGLGLATSLAIVRSHGGFMQVYSEPGRGTRFTVGLPVAHSDRRVESAHRDAVLPLPRGAGELILVVDDDETIRLVTSQALEAHGYRTITASHGNEAIDVIETGSDIVDLVITDMMMPVMDGAAMSAYLEEHHPSIPIIAASGFTAGGSESPGIGLGISRFIAKPYTTNLLLTTVRDSLREHRSTER